MPDFLAQDQGPFYVTIHDRNEPDILCTNLWYTNYKSFELLHHIIGSPRQFFSELFRLLTMSETN